MNPDKAQASNTNYPPEWNGAVPINAFSNLDRLNHWTGAGTWLKPNSDPHTLFSPVAPGSVGNASGTVYVVVHGWAPGYAGKTTWWGQDSAVGGVWPSAWAWEPLTIGDGSFTVNNAGLLQSLPGINSKAPDSPIALAYSWLDESATDDDVLHAYQSEAYTHANGLRLADALQQALSTEFVTSGGRLHLIGHSHGSKVCTVAAIALQQANVPVARLTILDSPESDSPLGWNGANLLGSYLQSLKIMDPSNPDAGGTFVENYASYFDVMFGNAELSGVIGVSLNPSGTNSSPSIDDCHSYAAGWYGASATSSTSVGLAWTVPPTTAPLQQAPSPSTKTQFTLTGGSTFPTFAYNAYSLRLTDGNGNSVSEIVFSPDNAWQSPIVNSFVTNNVPPHYWESDQYGIAFDLSWTSPQAGDWLAVSVTGDMTYTVLNLDGLSAPNGTTTVFINVAVVDISGTANLSVYFVPTSSSPDDDQVTLNNFRWIDVR